MNTQHAFISSTAESALKHSVQPSAQIASERISSIHTHLMNGGIFYAGTSDLCGAHGSDAPLIERVYNDTENVDRCASTRRNTGGVA